MSAFVTALIEELRQHPDALAELRALIGIEADGVQEDSPAFFTTTTLAAQLDVTERTIRRAITSGELPAHRRCERWVIDADDARRWLEAGPTPTVPAYRPRPSAATRGARAMVASIEGQR